jgi:hypothetical protein
MGGGNHTWGGAAKDPAPDRRTAGKTAAADAGGYAAGAAVRSTPDGYAWR